jgi:hypothetical protein
VAALAQNGDGLRADQAGSADDDDLHGLPLLVDYSRLQPYILAQKKSSQKSPAREMRSNSLLQGIKRYAGIKPALNALGYREILVFDSGHQQIEIVVPMTPCTVG